MIYGFALVSPQKDDTAHYNPSRRHFVDFPEPETFLRLGRIILIDVPSIHPILVKFALLLTFRLGNLVLFGVFSVQM